MASDGQQWGSAEIARYTAIFQLYDLDGNEEIDREEYSNLLDRIEKKEGRPTGVSRNAFLFHRFDLDNDGIIRIDEFLGGIEDVGKSQGVNLEQLAIFLERGPTKKAKKKTASPSPGAVKKKALSPEACPPFDLASPALSEAVALPDVPPELEGKYALIAKVGKGGFATVYRAHGKGEMANGALPYAVKVVDFAPTAAKVEAGATPDSQSEQVRTMTIGECEIMGRASTESIIKLYEVCEHCNTMWMVIEYMGGGDLEAHVKHNGGLDEPAAVHVFKQVCEAVDYCHNVLEVVHRDLKPENILICEQPRSRDDLISVKLADFGLATPYESTRQMTLFCGTPYFFAPELVKDAGYSRAVDCWSLGVILYFILSGKLAFMSKSKEELHDLICSGKFEFPEKEWATASDSSKDLIKRLLNVNALQRYSVKEAIDHPWMFGERTIEALAPTVFDMLKVDN